MVLVDDPCALRLGKDEVEEETESEPGVEWDPIEYDLVSSAFRKETPR